jgi:hypothetical protein
METVLSDPVSVSTKKFVAPGSAIAAKHIDLEIRRPETGSQVVEQVEHSRVVIVNGAGAVVPQIAVQVSERFLIISVAITVDDVQVLSRMGVKQSQAVPTV